MTTIALEAAARRVLDEFGTSSEGLQQLYQVLESSAPSAAEPEAALTWYEGAPPFPQDQEWFIAETIHGDRVVLRSLDEGREQRGNYKFKTADQTYMKAELVKRWTQFPDCEFIPPSPPAPAPSAASEREAFKAWFEAWHDPNVGSVENAVERIAAWAAWQARSTTVDAPVAEPVALTEKQRRVLEHYNFAQFDADNLAKVPEAVRHDLWAMLDEMGATNTRVTIEFDVEMDQALFERDEREEVINAILDEVLGLDRHEWSSAYGFADAIEDVKTRMWALTHPPAPEDAKGAADHVSLPRAALHRDVTQAKKQLDEFGFRASYLDWITNYSAPRQGGKA